GSRPGSPSPGAGPGFSRPTSWAKKGSSICRSASPGARGTLKRRTTRTRAYLESIRYYVSHREEAIKKSMQLLKIDDRQAAEAGYDYRLKTLPPDGKLSVKGMQLVIDAAAEDDAKAKSLTPQQLFDLSFLP